MGTLPDAGRLALCFNYSEVQGEYQFGPPAFPAPRSPSAMPCCRQISARAIRNRKETTMSGWYFDEKLSNLHHADLVREANNERRAKEARAEAVSSPILPRLFSWLGEQASKNKTLASQKLSYLDNPDPFRNCVTC
jgi:hypothetical protein